MVNFNPALLLPRFQYQDRNVAVASGDKVIAVQNPQRVWIGFTITTTGMWIRSGTVAAVNLGFTGSAFPACFFFSFAEAGALVTNEWHAFIGGVGGSVYVQEVIYNPEGGA